MPCKQTYEMHIQMHHPSSWACSPYLCAQNFNWSLSFSLLSPYVIYQVYLYVSLPFDISPPFSLYLCFSPPLSSMTTKVQNIDSITCRVKIINVNQWGENQFPKFGPIKIIYQRYLTRFDPRTSFFTPPNKGYLVPYWVKHL